MIIIEQLHIMIYVASIEGLLVLSSQALAPLLREDNTSSPSIVAKSSKASLTKVNLLAKCAKCAKNLSQLVKISLTQNLKSLQKACRHCFTLVIFTILSLKLNMVEKISLYKKSNSRNSEIQLVQWPSTVVSLFLKPPYTVLQKINLIILRLKLCPRTFKAKNSEWKGLMAPSR